MNSFRLLTAPVILALLAGVVLAAAPAATAVPRVQTPAALAAIPADPAPAISLNRIGRYSSGLGSGSSEIVAYDPATARMFITNAVSATLDIVDITNPVTPTLRATIPLSPTYGAVANSVDVRNGVVAVAVEANPKTDPGKVVFFDTSGNFLNQATVGALPDMVLFTPDGKRVLTANEGEPNNLYTVDPEGSISIIDLPTDVLTTTSVLTVTNAGFGSFNGQLDALRSAGVRIFGPGATVAQDLEPEYIAVSPDATTAFVTLQENNALAVVNLATKTVAAVLPLGLKNHNLAGNGLDPSDRDGPAPANTAIKIGTWPVLGMYQPDSIASYAVGGTTYLVTANEGDARVYPPEDIEGGPDAGDILNEEVRVGSSGYTLDSTVFPDAATLKQNANLGRLTVTNQSGNTDADAEFEQIHVFGARSFTIWNASTGAVTFDSGDDLEQRTSVLTPGLFNANNGRPADFDTRSDNKGPEPEAIELGAIGGRTYAFVGLERSGGGVMVYDITNPVSPTFIQYALPPGTYTPAPGTTPDDVSPEGLAFVPQSESPNGQALLLVANEVSGSVGIYGIRAKLRSYLPLVNR